MNLKCRSIYRFRQCFSTLEKINSVTRESYEHDFLGTEEEIATYYVLGSCF